MPAPSSLTSTHRHGAAAGPRRAHGDAHRPGAVGERVLDQHADGLAKPARRGVHRQVPRAAHRELPPGRDESRLPLGLDLRELVRKGHLARAGGALGAGRREQVVDDGDESICLIERLLDLGGDVRVRVVREFLQPQPQAGEPGPQLMRDIPGEIAFPADEGRDVLRGGVEDVGDPIELGHAGTGGGTSGSRRSPGGPRAGRRR